MKQFNNLKNTGEQQTIIKRIVLHFDVNKTLILQDSKEEKSKEDNLHEILSGYAWGKIETYQDQQQWKLMHTVYSINSPNHDYISYQEYVYLILELPVASGLSKSKQYNEQKENILMKRKELFNNLVKQNNPGAKLKADYEKIIKQVNLPRQVLDEMKISKDQLQGTQVQQTMMQTKNLTKTGEFDKEGDGEAHELLELFQDGRYFILPYFFKFLINLKKNKKDFSVVFRTMGDDLNKIIEEMNYFSQGQHPCFSGKAGLPLVRFDGAKGSKNLVIENHHKLIIYRNHEDPDKMTAVFGTIAKTSNLGNIVEKLEEIYEKEISEEMIELVKDGEKIFIKIQETLKETSCMGIQDDLMAWEGNQNQQEFAKPFYIDQSDYSTLQIFFDDNIGEEKSVVDIRDIVTNQKISYQKAINKYLVKVDLLSVIRDPDYFMKCIKECEQNRVDEIDRIERGDQDIDIQLNHPNQDLYANLLNANHSDYLRITVIPLLYPALQLLDRERPDDPISYLAMYMLKNKDKVFIPEPKTQENQQDQNKNQEEQQI